tara:strand:+ start:227 stop:529 length:303 start_codon:yes stop_codon:yes gene_type:complete
MKKIFYSCIFIFLFSCASLQEAGKALRNEKSTTTDEFLVKKKEPLIMPPDLNEVPKPRSLKEKKQNEEDKIKKILKMPQTNDKKFKSGSTEDFIIDKIRK